MAELETITLSATADAVEVWDMFWNGSWILNAISDDNLDFGTLWDFSPTSKNLSPSKIRFFPVSGGHDHALLGKPLYKLALQKRNLDINGLRVLWMDYWNDIADETSTKYVVLTGRAILDLSVHPSAGGAYASNYIVRWVYLNHDISGSDPNSQGDNDSQFDAVRTSDYDTFWDTLQSSLKILAIFAQPEEANDAFAGPSVWIATTSVTANDWRVATAGYDWSSDAVFDVVVIARYTGIQ